MKFCKKIFFGLWFQWAYTLSLIGWTLHHSVVTKTFGSYLDGVVSATILIGSCWITWLEFSYKGLNERVQGLDELNSDEPYHE